MVPDKPCEDVRGILWLIKPSVSYLDGTVKDRAALMNIYPLVLY